MKKCSIKTLKHTVFKWKNYFNKYLILKSLKILPLKKFCRNKNYTYHLTIFCSRIFYKLTVCSMQWFFSWTISKGFYHFFFFFIYSLEIYFIFRKDILNKLPNCKTTQIKLFPFNNKKKFTRDYWKWKEKF